MKKNDNYYFIRYFSFYFVFVIIALSIYYFNFSISINIIAKNIIVFLYIVLVSILFAIYLSLFSVFHIKVGREIVFIAGIFLLLFLRNYKKNIFLTLIISNKDLYNILRIIFNTLSISFILIAIKKQLFYIKNRDE